MNSSCAKILKECLCEQIPWDDNQLFNLSYPMILYICKGSPAWQKGGCCLVLWYCFLFINLCGLILEQSALYPEISMVEKVLGLPYKTHSKHLSLPREQSTEITWKDQSRRQWHFLVGSVQLFNNAVKSEQNIGIHLEWERAICWIPQVVSSFLSDLTMGISEVEFNNRFQLSCKPHFSTVQPRNWALSILLNIIFRQFTLFKSFLSSICSFPANRRLSSPALYLFACW